MSGRGRGGGWKPRTGGLLLLQRSAEEVRTSSSMQYDIFDIK